MSDTTAVARAGFTLSAPRALYFAIFAISGFSGLIYESIWSHYLKLFLGHAAYAQSLVLIIFMGGMAAGSWLASRYSLRVRIPILAYAVVEAIVGLVALVFHDLFAGLIDVFHASVLPGIDSPAIGITTKWLAASLLILPQSVLLGMTFPLMSAGIIRRFPDTPGGSIAMLYFTNSIGAAIGVLTSGFVFIRLFGLPGTIMTAGLLNIALAVVVWVLVRLDPRAESDPIATPPRTASGDALTKLFLVAAFITGAASFIYEISWIRMLSLVLGATTHSFELMLSAFITGLAFGGLWIKRRIDKVADPVRFSGYVQLIMGALALLTIPVYIMTFEWMATLRSALQTTDAAFTGYTLASHGIALAVMLPTTFMAGMTLPLFTYVLLRKGCGESSIGRIYAANTVGAIVGVLFAVHIGLPMLGLKNLIVFGAALDIALGFVLVMRYSASSWKTPRFATTSIAVAAICVTVVIGVALDQRLLTSGVYRVKRTNIAAEDDLVFYRDGKTASVSFRVTPMGFAVLSTNGKPDASIQMDPAKPATPDEATMILAGAIPLAYAPGATRVANIGMGSGQTAHTVLGDPSVEVLDTIEIEVEMVNASRNYGDAVARAYDDPRSRIHIEDAKTFFSLNNSRYDIIIAEPSNPWVSGVSSLFSHEFYSTINNYLADDGLFVQWIQAYEFTDELATSILKALTGNFEDYQIYLSNSSDVILIARKTGRLEAPQWHRIFQGELGKSLASVGINGVDDMLIRQSASRAMLLPYLEDAPVLANSDYYPFVDLNAGKAMFAGSEASMFTNWMLSSVPVLEMLGGSEIRFAAVTPGQPTHRARRVDVANWVFEKLTVTRFSDPPEIETAVPPAVSYGADWLAASQNSCIAESNPQRWAETAFLLAASTLPYLEPDRAAQFVAELDRSACSVADYPAGQSWLDLYRAVAARDGAGMLAAGQALLASPLEHGSSEKAFIIDAAMLGAVAAENPQHGFAVWEQHGAEFYADKQLPGHTRLLLSLSARFGEAATRTATN